MTRRIVHARILAFPYADSLQSARLDALHQKSRGKRCDLVIDYHELCQLAPPELSICDGQPCERVQGCYVLRRLRFIGVRWLKPIGLYTQLDALPLDHGARSLRGILYCSPPGQEAWYLLFNGLALRTRGSLRDNRASCPCARLAAAPAASGAARARTPAITSSLWRRSHHHPIGRSRLPSTSLCWGSRLPEWAATRCRCCPERGRGAKSVGYGRAASPR